MNAPGIVSTHAHITRLATPHRTALKRCVVPTPTIAPLIVCVVDTGTPPNVARPSEIAAEVSDAIPPTGCSFVIFDPIVWTIRHPPNRVPSPIARCAEKTTHNGTGAFCYKIPLAINTVRITPIVFCASLPPWPNENAAAEKSWPRRNARFSLSTLR